MADSLTGRRWREWRGTLLLLGLMFVFRSAWADWVTVPTGSMNPTIVEGDRLLVNKHVYGLRLPFTLLRLTEGSNPTRGDIVVFDSPRDGTSLVKRVIGLPGDELAMLGETLYINGEPCGYASGDPASLRDLLARTLAEAPEVRRERGPLPAHEILLLPARAGHADFAPLTVPAGHYFMLGDNRDNSADSRYIGFVPRRNIVGRASRVVVSLDPGRHYLPRGDRWLKPLD